MTNADSNGITVLVETSVLDDNRDFTVTTASHPDDIRHIAYLPVGYDVDRELRAKGYRRIGDWKCDDGGRTCVAVYQPHPTVADCGVW